METFEKVVYEYPDHARILIRVFNDGEWKGEAKYVVRVFPSVSNIETVIIELPRSNKGELGKYIREVISATRLE